MSDFGFERLGLRLEFGFFEKTKSEIPFDNLMPPCMKGFPSGYCVFAISLASFPNKQNIPGQTCLYSCQKVKISLRARGRKKMSANKDKKKKKKKKTALVICRDRKQFWTTQTQFWQWVREGVITKTDDSPLTGTFTREHEELLVLLSNTVLNLAHPNHMREALLSRRVGLARK